MKSYFYIKIESEEKEQMARYIDADKLIVKLNETQIEFDKNYYGLGEAKQIVDNAPTVDAIEIPENATYGDMIMKVLESAGNYKQEESNDVMYIYESGTPKLMRAAVDGKLWNKPFRRGREEMNQTFNF